MRTTAFFVGCVLLSVSLAGCGGGSGGGPQAGAAATDGSRNVTITQGVWGNVTFAEGNFMPGAATGTTKPAVRKVDIYQAVRLSQLPQNSTTAFFSNIPTKLVASAQADESGFYQVALPPGQYSVFAEESGGLYANGLSPLPGQATPEDYLAVTAVTSGQVVQHNIAITYKAAY